jgi:ketosteroid isomerase-like protein
MEVRSVVEAFFACWSAQDVEMALAHLHPEIVYTIHNGPDASPLAGVYSGTERVRDLAFSVLAEFDYLRYEPTIVSVDGDAVRAHVMFTLRHRESGCIIEGSRRIVIEMRGGLIGRYDLYEDGRRVEAFMRMARGSAPSEVGSELTTLLASRQTSGAGA